VSNNGNCSAKNNATAMPKKATAVPATTKMPALKQQQQKL